MPSSETRSRGKYKYRYVAIRSRNYCESPVGASHGIFFSKMETVKLYTWFCVTLLLVCGAFSVRSGQRCDPMEDKPTTNSYDCHSYYICMGNEYKKVDCDQAPYFGSLSNLCKTKMGKPCPSE